MTDDKRYLDETGIAALVARIKGEIAAAGLGSSDVSGMPSVMKAGTVVPYAGGIAPVGYLMCDGAAYSREEFADLFAAIGTKYGPGDGAATFNVPNLSGRVPIGVSSTFPLGAAGGETEHQLIIDEIPGHIHCVNQRTASSGNGKSDARGIMSAYDVNPPDWVWADAAWATPQTTSTGGSKSHNNMQPYISLNFIISTGKTVDLSVYDSGWEKVYYVEGSICIEARRVGNIVTVKGECSGYYDIGGTKFHAVATLPRQFRPTSNVYFAFTSKGTVMDNPSAYIASDGTINMYSTSSVLNYWAFSIAYPVDGSFLTPTSETGMADWVIARGASGAWTWEKWASGKAICTLVGSGYSMTGTQWNGFFLQSIDIVYPFSFTSYPHLEVQAKVGTGVTLAYSYQLDKTKACICMASSQNGEAWITARAEGKWK